jgi:intein/homing endonuclease
MKELEKQICHLYSKKWKIIDIASKIQKRQSFVSNILKRNKLRIRTAKDVDFLSYQLNHSFFLKIQNENQAYLLGLLFADGCVAKESNTISLVSNDIELIRHFKQSIKCNKEIYRNPNHKNAYTFYFCSPKMKKDLIKIGCIPQKSLILKFPCLSKKLIRHFLRGNFDGDGCITGTRQIQAYFLGTFSFLTSVENFLSNVGIFCNKIQNNGNIFRLRITGKENLKKLHGLLYDNSSFFLKRKESKF